MAFHQEMDATKTKTAMLDGAGLRKSGALMPVHAQIPSVGNWAALALRGDEKPA